MNSITHRTNPFVLMLDPEAVISAMERSQPLRGLSGRICRPLDKPLIPTLFKTHISEFDAAIDAEAFRDSGLELQTETQAGSLQLH